MVRGHEEVLTSQEGSRKGTPRETHVARNLVAAMSAEELRLYSQIPTKIGLETSDGAAISIVGEANNVV